MKTNNSNFNLNCLPTDNFPNFSDNFTGNEIKLEKNKLREIINFCKKNNIKFFSMYGQTEASPRISYLKPEFSKKKIGSIGKGLSGNKIYIINNNGKFY